MGKEGRVNSAFKLSCGDLQAALHHDLGHAYAAQEGGLAALVSAGHD